MTDRTEPDTQPEQTVHPLTWCVQVRQLVPWMKRHSVPSLGAALRRLSDQAQGSASGSVQETFIGILDK